LKSDPAGTVSPWRFIPLLYFMQAVPVTLVQDVATVVYKDLGIANESITRWTSLIALPWSLQMILGPLVDLNGTKRRWITGGQLAIAAGLILAAFALGTPRAFELSLVILGFTAVASALTNIATDGFVILSTTKNQQAKFAGFMSTFYRLGRLFGASLLVFIAGVLMRSMPAGQAWPIVFFLGTAVYGLAHLGLRPLLPRPEADIVKGDRAETSITLRQTFALLGTALGGYFMVNAIVRLVAHAMAVNFDIMPGWRLPEDNRIPQLMGVVEGGQIGSPVMTEVAQLAVAGTVAVLSVSAAIRWIRGREMGNALGSFFAQERVAAILFFILFYRFGEAMVGKITPLFLKDAVDKGGLAIANEQLGILSGGFGVIGIILGGITGGWVVSKVGLRRAFIPLALAMHVPNVLYLLASYRLLPMQAYDLPWLGPLSPMLGGMLFVDQFGYGFGFAGYMIYLMWVAQRGNFVTSHYAIGTGLGALCIAIAGILSGVVQANFGYSGVFWAVLVGSIPGLLALLWIPLEDAHRSIKVSVE
jgi:PAT family beta-lactamase induction signal transducer AmpG